MSLVLLVEAQNSPPAQPAVSLVHFAVCQYCEQECGSASCYVGKCGINNSDSIGVERFRSSNQCWTCDVDAAETTGTLDKEAAMTACGSGVHEVATNPEDSSMNFMISRRKQTSSSKSRSRVGTSTQKNMSGAGSVEDLQGFAKTTLESAKKATSDAAALAKAAEEELASKGAGGGEGGADGAEASAAAANAEGLATEAMAKEAEAQNLQKQLDLAKKAHEEAAKSYLAAYEELKVHELKAQNLSQKLTETAKLTKQLESEYASAVAAATALSAKSQQVAKAAGVGSAAERAEATSILHAAQLAQANAETAVFAAQAVAKKLGMEVGAPAEGEEAAAPAEEGAAPAAAEEAPPALLLTDCSRTSKGFLQEPCKEQMKMSSMIANIGN